MPILTSLYIHLPWCIRKCPYCDFNSHAVKDNFPETLYVNALLQELAFHLPRIQGRTLTSIFFGGGTPSLFSAQSIQNILQGVAQQVSLAQDIEITLEANPGTMEQQRFHDFRSAGINRLSLGIQSLNNDKLQVLGRIHDAEQALSAIRTAQTTFDNYNLDLMFGLPQQTVAEAELDLQTALAFEPPHLSWYQLTIEPNTLFYKQTPVLPSEDDCWQMQVQGQALLQNAGLLCYEVSAYAQAGRQCRHNLNYWAFGDYLGIGAGAHSKITDFSTGEVQRFAQVKHPRDYLDAAKRQQIQAVKIAESDLIFEFMLNALRLTEGFPLTLFTERTGLKSDVIMPILNHAKQRGLLQVAETYVQTTALGKRFLNELIALFLPETMRVR